MKSSNSPLIGRHIRRKHTGETFTITSREGAFALLDGGADHGGRHVMLSELVTHYEAVPQAASPRYHVLKRAA